MAKVPMQRPVGRVSRAACRLGVLRVLVPRPICSTAGGIGAGTLSLAFQGGRPVTYPRNTSGVQSPDSKLHKTSHRLAVN